MNVVIKLLTAVTIVLTLPTLISSFYGMNVNLPFADWPHMPWVILAASVLAAGGVAWLFIKRDWM
jgi:magnesium transporter